MRELPQVNAHIVQTLTHFPNNRVGVSGYLHNARLLISLKSWHPCDSRFFHMLIAGYLKIVISYNLYSNMITDAGGNLFGAG